MSNQKTATAITWIVLAIILLCVVGKILFLFLMFGLEGYFTKWDINNPYVNRRYREWKTNTLDASNSIKIPNEWCMTEDGGVLSIVDEHEELWSVGTSFGSDKDAYTSYSAFASDFVPIEESSISIQPLEGFDAMNGSEMYTLTCCDSEYAGVYYCLELHKPNVDYFFILFTDLSESADEYNIAEAIVYSFAY